MLPLAEFRQEGQDLQDGHNVPILFIPYILSAFGLFELGDC
jgi:hypothetical protein